METSGLEPEITICKIVVLPVKLCPLKPGYLGQAPWTPSKASFSSLPCMPPLPGQGVFSFVLDAPLLPSFPPPTRSEDSPPYTPQIPFRSPPPIPLRPIPPTSYDPHPIPPSLPPLEWIWIRYDGTDGDKGMDWDLDRLANWNKGAELASHRPSSAACRTATLRPVPWRPCKLRRLFSSWLRSRPSKRESRPSTHPCLRASLPGRPTSPRPPFASLPQALGLIARTLPVPWPYLLGSVLALAYA